MGYFKEKTKRLKRHFLVTLRREGFTTEEVGLWTVSEAQAVYLAKRSYKTRHGLSDSAFVYAEVREHSPRRRRRQSAVTQHELW